MEETNNGVINKVEEICDHCIDGHNDRGQIIYRYQFSQEFMDVLYQFSKIHQYDDRKSFKEHWTLWVENNEDMIDKEKEVLENKGYNKSNILEKMYISSRYYFRKKPIVHENENENKVKRNQYIPVQKSLIKCMDVHILNNRHNNFKPSLGFIDFCNNNKSEIKEELSILLKNKNNDIDYIREKIKKTYKNRCFSIFNK